MPQHRAGRRRRTKSQVIHVSISFFVKILTWLWDSEEVAATNSDCPYGDMLWGDDVFGYEGHHYQVLQQLLEQEHLHWRHDFLPTPDNWRKRSPNDLERGPYRRKLALLQRQQGMCLLLYVLLPSVNDLTLGRLTRDILQISGAKMKMSFSSASLKPIPSGILSLFWSPRFFSSAHTRPAVQVVLCADSHLEYQAQRLDWCHGHEG